MFLTLTAFYDSAFKNDTNKNIDTTSSKFRGKKNLIFSSQSIIVKHKKHVKIILYFKIGRHLWVHVLNNIFLFLCISEYTLASARAKEAFSLYRTMGELPYVKCIFYTCCIDLNMIFFSFLKMTKLSINVSNPPIVCRIKDHVISLLFQNPSNLNQVNKFNLMSHCFLLPTLLFLMQSS